MAIMKSIGRRLAFLLVIGAASLAFVVLAVSTGKAHEAECPFCKLALVQNTDKLDNEVVVTFGNKKIEYRCIYCVFADQGRYKGDLVVNAPSEKKGAPVVIKRTAGTWTAPDSTVFLQQFKRHKNCASNSRAFTSKAAFAAYVKENGISDATALTLAQELAEVAKREKTAAPAKDGEHEEEHHDEHKDDSTHHDDDHGSH